MVDSGIITEIKRFATHDGPGIRTAVFMKGCPLHCTWCSNPETINLHPQLYFIQKRCRNSGACITVCPENAITSDDENKILLNRGKCTICFQCAENCISRAFIRIGTEYTTEEILNEIKKDIPFYGDDGGLTLSGGEPLFQHEFSLSILKRCREAGISTVLDTSGYAATVIVEEIAKYSDLVLLDIKHLDTVKHKEETGVGNELILKNARVFALKTKIRISLPLVPGFNDDDENIEETARFAKELNSTFIDINPYHTFGADKYEYLGLENPYKNYPQLKKDDIVKVKALIEEFGLKTTIGRMM